MEKYTQQTLACTTQAIANANRVEVKGVQVKVGDFVRASFASLNKQDSLEEYREQVGKRATIDKVKIEKIVVLSFKEFNRFEKSGFLTNCNLWGEGGWTEEYRIGTLVVKADLGRDGIATATCWQNLPAFVVDAQGYKYARYVGLHPIGEKTATTDLSGVSIDELLAEVKRRTTA
jgi:hypothetical protein